MEIEFREFPKAKVFVGGCVERGEGSSFHASAHAHTTPSDKFHNWICVRSKQPRAVHNYCGEPTNTMLHEYAHILTGEGHTKKFWTMLANIGGFMERESYFGHKAKDYMKIKKNWSDIKSEVMEGRI